MSSHVITVRWMLPSGATQAVTVQHRPARAHGEPCLAVQHCKPERGTAKRFVRDIPRWAKKYKADVTDVMSVVS
jgi:hypothetical protein